MWVFIPYLLVQAILWFVFQGNFSVLAKSSEVFVLLSIVRSAINLGDVDSLINQLEEYLLKNLYRQFRRTYRARLDSVYIRHIEILILSVATLGLQFL